MKSTLKAIVTSAVAAVLLLSTPSFAAEVPGKVFYKMPSGELVKREVSLDVPARGQGKVILKSEHYTLESHAFKTKKSHGRIAFSVLFLDPPGAPAKTAMVLTGTYLRGTNHVVYYGDIYSRSYAEESQVDDVASKLLNDFASVGEDHPEQGHDAWKFAGGFKFGKPLSAE